MKQDRQQQLITMQPVAVMRSDFAEKFGIPRQAGLVPQLRSIIEFVPEYGTEDFVKGLEGFSHLWLLWGVALGRCGLDFAHIAQLELHSRNAEELGIARIAKLRCRIHDEIAN